jgi:hypothetical protein
MLNLSAAALFGVLLGVGLAAPAGAIPYGSYQQSCKDIRLKGERDSARIQARCLDRAGQWRKTSFELDRCIGDLANVDGRLVCVAGPVHGGPPGYPGGPPHGRPKDVAVDVCSDWATRAAYRDGAAHAYLRRIEDVDRKDAGRIKVKGIVDVSRKRDGRNPKGRPFRCDVRHGQVIDFRWR